MPELWAQPLGWPSPSPLTLFLLESTPIASRRLEVLVKERFPFTYIVNAYRAPTVVQALMGITLQTWPHSVFTVAPGDTNSKCLHFPSEEAEA